MADDRSDRASVPTLIVTGGPLDGTAYPLPGKGETVVGSSMDAGVQIMLGNVEPFHARIVDGPGGLVIEDAGSATGTFVNGEKVEGPHPLQEGDRICLGPPGAKGSAKLLVRMAPADEAPVEAVPVLSFAAEEEAPAPEFDLSTETVFDAESVVVADSASGPPLEATEVAAPEDEGDALFAEPIPAAPARPEASPGPPAAFAAPPPPPPPPTFAAPAPPPPPPPAPARPAAERLTAPPPPEPPARPPAPPPPPPPREAARPDYQTELPSIPFADPPAEPAERSEFPPLRPAAEPAARPAGGKGKGRAPARRRRSFTLPSIPVVPILGGAGALAAVAALVWFFFLRGTPPEVASVTPETVETGQSVTLAGEHFAATGRREHGPLRQDEGAGGRGQRDRAQGGGAGRREGPGAGRRADEGWTVEAGHRHRAGDRQGGRPGARRGPARPGRAREGRGLRGPEAQRAGGGGRRGRRRGHGRGRASHDPGGAAARGLEDVPRPQGGHGRAEDVRPLPRPPAVRRRGRRRAAARSGTASC